MAEQATSLASSHLVKAISATSCSSPSTAAYLNARRIRNERLKSISSESKKAASSAHGKQSNSSTKLDRAQYLSHSCCQSCGELLIPGVNAHTQLERADPAVKRRAGVEVPKNASIGLVPVKKKRTRRAGKHVQQAKLSRRQTGEKSRLSRAIIITTCGRCNKRWRTSFVAPMPQASTQLSNERHKESHSENVGLSGTAENGTVGPLDTKAASLARPTSKPSTRRSRGKSRAADVKGLLQAAKGKTKSTQGDVSGGHNENTFSLMDFMKS